MKSYQINFRITTIFCFPFNVNLMINYFFPIKCIFERKITIKDVY